MRKNRLCILCATIMLALGLCLGLSACGKDASSSSSFESDKDWGKVTFENVTDEVAGSITLPADYVGMTIELEKGTVDVTVNRLTLEDDEEEEASDELSGEELFHGEGLDSGTYSFGVPGGGECMVTISGDGAPGTITFAETEPEPV